MFARILYKCDVDGCKMQHVYDTRQFAGRNDKHLNRRQLRCPAVFCRARSFARVDRFSETCFFFFCFVFRPSLKSNGHAERDPAALAFRRQFTYYCYYVFPNDIRETLGVSPCPTCRNHNTVVVTTTPSKLVRSVDREKVA